MKTFLITMLVLLVIALGSTSFNLQGSHPRIPRSVSRKDDLIALFIQAGMLVWIINLLLGLP